MESAVQSSMKDLHFDIAFSALEFPVGIEFWLSQISSLSSFQYVLYVSSLFID